MKRSEQADRTIVGGAMAGIAAIAVLEHGKRAERCRGVRAARSPPTRRRSSTRDRPLRTRPRSGPWRCGCRASRPGRSAPCRASRDGAGREPRRRSPRTATGCARSRHWAAAAGTDRRARRRCATAGRSGAPRRWHRRARHGRVPGDARNSRSAVSCRDGVARGRGLGNRGINLDRSLPVALPGKDLCASGACRGQSFVQVLVVDDAEARSGDRVAIVRIDGLPVADEPDDVGRAAVSGGDDGKPRRAGFEKGQTERLMQWRG